MKKRYCPKCKGLLIVEPELKEYKYYCIECDENFYNFKIKTAVNKTA